MRHYTSRAGDPHRHLHLQVNARVFAAGKWRGLDTVAVRDSIDAINGIGHAAVMCDPEFRAALAAHGYTLNADGEIEQLARFVGPVLQAGGADRRDARPLRGRVARASIRARSRGRGCGGRGTRGRGPRTGRTRSCRARVRSCGAVARPSWPSSATATATSRSSSRCRWPGGSTGTPPSPRCSPGSARRGRRGTPRTCAARSNNCSPAHGIVADAAVRRELAEDLTARALALCVPLREQPTPEHVRALTSQHVLDVEADLVARLAARGAAAATPARPCAPSTNSDAGQRAAVARARRRRPTGRDRGRGRRRQDHHPRRGP